MNAILFFTIVGLMILLPLIDSLYFYNFTIKKWGFTEGEIIKNSPADDGDGGWQREIQYSYYVNDVEYTNNRVTKNIFSVPFEYRTEYKYCLGTKVTIYYNPEKPQKSIIDGAFNPLNFVAVFISAVFFLLFFFIFIR